MVRQTLIVVHHVVMIGEPKTARGRRVIALDVGKSPRCASTGSGSSPSG
jgi:hypothetical protein